MENIENTEKTVAQLDQENFIKYVDVFQQRDVDGDIPGFAADILWLKLKVVDRQETNKLKTWIYSKSSDNSQQGLTLFGSKIETISWSNIVDLYSEFEMIQMLIILEKLDTNYVEQPSIELLFLLRLVFNGLATNYLAETKAQLKDGPKKVIYKNIQADLSLNEFDEIIISESVNDASMALLTETCQYSNECFILLKKLLKEK